MVEYLIKSVRVPEVRRKVIFTLAILALFRFLAHIPVPNVNADALKTVFSQNQFLGLLNLFSGGGLQNLSLAALGVGPYISSSIIFQLLTMAVPKLKEISLDGTYGRQKINQYTRLFTLPVALIQSYGIYAFLSKQSVAGSNIFSLSSPFDLLIVIMYMCAGTFILTWLGDLITEKGVSNGISILIFAGILSGIISSFGSTFAVASSGSAFGLGIFVVVMLLVIGAVVYINESYRKVEIHYSRRVEGGKSYGGGGSYIPIKINQAGVMPIIFAVVLIIVPSVLAGYLQSLTNPPLVDLGIWLGINFRPGSLLYNMLYFTLVFAFTYFYTSVAFNPKEISDNIRKSGGFVLGVRPGRATVAYLRYVINRLTFAGGVFLGLVAILPSMVQSVTNVTTLAIGGTGLLIVVSVVLEMVKQIESQVITREYETFIK